MRQTLPVRILVLTIGMLLMVGLPAYAQTKVQISSISPTSANIGSTVKISGSGFSTTPTLNLVFFTAANTTTVPGVVTTASTTALNVTVPTGAITGKVYV